jgi:hypothetical protein
MPQVETGEAAAPATKLAEEVRLFIVVISLSSTLRG